MKKWAKFLCCFALLGAFLVGGLAGCGPTVNIQNNSSELIYNGNAAAVVASGNDNFVFFGNAYASTAPTNKSEYSSAKEYSYLARVNGKNLEAKNAYFSPKQVDNISDEVTAYEDSFMFVLGQNVYYATPNLQMVSQDGEAAYHYEYTCFYKSDLNGGGKHKLFTTTGEVSNIEVLKSGETYYIVMLAGENLVTINLSNDSATTIASGVTSVALPKTYRQDVVGSTLDWNGIIYFTTERENTSGSGATTNLVKKIVVTAKNEDEAQEVYTQGTVTFIARERDVLFFTDTVANSQKAVYMVDMSGAASNSAFLPSSNKRKAIYEGSSVTESSVSDLHLVTMTTYSGEQSTNIVRGYVYKTGSAFRFLTTSGKKGTFTLTGDDMSSAKVLFVSGQIMYLATNSGLYRAELAKIFNGTATQTAAEKFASLSGISTNAAVAFDGEYLYVYATLQEIPEELQDDSETEGETDEESEENTETDENLYLHRARVSSIDEFELLGRTTIESRRTK